MAENENHKKSQLKGKNTKKMYLLVTWDVNENFTKLQGEGRMVRNKVLTPTSDRVTLHAFARWLVSSKRVLGQFRHANTTHGFDNAR